jgi:hypothetical protein
MNDRDLPLSEPCPHCKTESQIKRLITNIPRIAYGGAKSNLARAGSGWNDLLTSIKKASGRSNTIQTR